MNLNLKRQLVLTSLKSAKDLEDKSDIVLAILKCIQDGYSHPKIDVDNNSLEFKLDELSSFLVNEMKFYINSLKS